MPPYDPVKGAMRAPPLSTTSTPVPISPPRNPDHLPIGAPSPTSIERRHVVIYVGPPPSGAIGENPHDLFSLSTLSRQPLEPRSGRAAPGL
jgi:hypothetical protein